MVESVHRASPVDPTHYPVSEKVPEPVLQRLMMEELRPLVQRWLDERGETAFAGADQFIYWVQYEPTTRAAPDVYVLPGVPRDADFGAWKVWETGIRPSLVIEIVGKDVQKDYVLAPQRYEAMGVEELVVCDPGYAESPERRQWQVWRRRGSRLRRAEATDAVRVRSEVLGCWLRMVGRGTGRRIRIATGPLAEVLFPTLAESEAQRADAETRRAEAETQRADAAEAELARLRAELQKR